MQEKIKGNKNKIDNNFPKMAEKRSDGEKRRMNQHQMRRLTSALSVLENKDRNKKMPKKWNSKRKLRHI